MEIMQVENVLKSVYLEIISNQLNANISSVLAKVEYTSNDIYGCLLYTSDAADEL